VIDPDGDALERIVKKQFKIEELPLPLLDKWSTDLTNLPEKFCYLAIFEYLIKRKMKILRDKTPQDNSSTVRVNNDETTDGTYQLPTAEKPLRKGYNFFASGHVDQVKINTMENVRHLSAVVLSSMKKDQYKVKIVLDNKSGLVIKGTCECVAGKAGKCNHVAALLYYCLDFQHCYKCTPSSKTEKLQEWSKPSRKSKQNTKPTKTGDYFDYFVILKSGKVKLFDCSHIILFYFIFSMDFYKGILIL